MLTIKDILEIKALEGIKIVAGEQGIHNEIALVNIIENPDAFDWLTPNELLLPAVGLALRSLVTLDGTLRVIDPRFDIFTEAKDQLGVRSVPFFVFENRYGIKGAEPNEVFVRTLHQAAGIAGIQPTVTINGNGESASEWHAK